MGKEGAIGLNTALPATGVLEVPLTPAADGPADVPEPPTLLALGIGLPGGVAARRGQRVEMR